MVAVKAGDVDGALRRVDARTPVLLIYGPDAGLVAERARAAAESAVADPSDPFQLIRIDGDAIASDPARLADEASTMGLFGNRRAIWVKPTSRNIAAAVDAVLGVPLPDTSIVLEAGDLAKSSPLRSLCERSPKALALPCYPDNDRDLAAVVDETLRMVGLAIDRNARAALLASLGGDRLATRAELAKLTLYAHGRREVTLADIDAVVSDVSTLALDSVVDGAFGGNLVALDDGLQRCAADGTAPSVLLGAVLRHALALLSAAQDVAAGRSVAEAVGGWRGLNFRRKSAVERQLGRWRPPVLRRVIADLQAAVLGSRRAPDLGAALAGRTLLDIAAWARRPT
jgi:DNA polymerase-3 subunit delta